MTSLACQQGDRPCSLAQMPQLPLPVGDDSAKATDAEFPIKRGHLKLMGILLSMLDLIQNFLVFNFDIWFSNKSSWLENKTYKNNKTTKKYGIK